MKAITLVFAAVLCASGAASAQERRDPMKPQSGIGLSFEAGGGFGGFISGAAASTTTTQGQWQARMVIGTRTHFAGEAGYVGSAQGVQTLGVQPNAVMTGNGLEGLFRFNVLTGRWQPYAAGGVGFMYYSLGNAQITTADVTPTGTAATFPLGVGLSFRESGLVLDGRVSFHPATSTNILRGQNMSTWDVNARAGFEF